MISVRHHETLTIIERSLVLLTCIPFFIDVRNGHIAGLQGLGIN